MKILHLIHDHPSHPTIGGGGGVRVHEIAMRLAIRKHSIHIVSGWFEGCEAHVDPAPGVHLTFLGPHRRPACKAIEFAMAAWRALPKLAQDADVVIEDFSPYAPVGAFRFHRPGRPVILQVQNSVGARFLDRHGYAGLPLMAIERWYPSLYQHHILVGEHLSTHFIARDSRVIPMGYVTEPSSPVAISDRNYIACFGRIDFDQKGLDVLLQAIDGTDLPVWFAGGGKETTRLQSALKSFPKTRFLGKIQGVEKWKFLRGARFLVMPSRFEGQPIAAIESAAAGTPILASSIPELDFVSAENLGRQFTPFNASTLRDALIKMWSASSELADYSKAGRDFSKTRTWDHIARQFESALIEIKMNYKCDLNDHPRR